MLTSDCIKVVNGACVENLTSEESLKRGNHSPYTLSWLRLVAPTGRALQGTGIAGPRNLTAMSPTAPAGGAQRRVKHGLQNILYHLARLRVRHGSLACDVEDTETCALVSYDAWACAQGGRGEPERGQGYRKLWQQVTKVRPSCQCAALDMQSKLCGIASKWLTGLLHLAYG